MPFMKRSEIIERYGFDPMAGIPQDSGVSVVERVPSGPAAPITVTPDNVEKPEPPQEATVSSDPLSNAKAGITKSFFSDPLAIYGLGMGVFDYVVHNINPLNKEGKSFADAIYEEGGVDRVKGFIQQKADAVKAEHPDWNREQVLQEVDRWRSTSEEFYKFNANQMRTGLKQSMLNDLEINKAAGVNKLPSQETTIDALTQLGASVAIPNPLGAIAGIASRSLSRGVGRAATNAIRVFDALAAPGTDIAEYGARSVGTNFAVGAGIDQAIRAATDQPNVFEGNAFPELSKEQMQLPMETGSDLPLSIGEVPLNADQVDEGIPNAAIAAGGVGAAVALGLGGRRAIRRFLPNVVQDPPRVNGNLSLTPNAQSIPEQAATRIPDAQGLERELERPTLESIGDSLDNTFDVQSGPGRLGEELGGVNFKERIDSIVETEISPSARENAVNRHLESGYFPDGFQGTRGRDFFVEARNAGEDAIRIFNEGMIAEEALYMRQLTRQAQADRLQMVHQMYQANPSPANRQRLQHEMQRSRMLNNDDRASRHSFQDISNADLQARVQRMMQDPRASRLRDRLGQLNTELTDYKQRSGQIDANEAAELRQRPHFTSLFENNKGRLEGWIGSNSPTPGAFSPSRSRDPVDFDFNDTGRTVINTTIDPFQSYAIRAANAISYGKYVQGANRTLRELRRRDPGGRTIQYLGNTGGRRIPGGYSIQLPVNGEMHTWITSRREVADAFNAQPYDMGMMMNLANKSRQMMQNFTTGPLAAATGGTFVTALRSLGYDFVSGAVFRNWNRSFGLAGSTTRRLMGRHQDAKVLRPINWIADATDASIFLPISVARLAPTLLSTTAWKTWGALGRQFMDAAIRTNGVWRTIDAIPGGRRFLQDMGQSMLRHMEATPIGLMQRHDIYNVNTMVSGAIGAQVRYDKYLDQLMNAGNNRTGRAMAITTYNAFKSFLSTIHDAAKIQFLAENMANLEYKYGVGRVPATELRKLAVEAKNLSGNMQATPAGPDRFQPNNLRGKAVNAARSVVRGTVHSLPYAQQMTQAVRYMLSSAFGHSSARSTAVAMRLGGVVMAYYAGEKMIEQMGLSDWYYDKYPDHQRVGNFKIPTLKTLEHLAETGQWPKVDPTVDNPREYFDFIKGTPEIMGFLVVPFMAGMEQFGLVNRGSNLSESSANKDIKMGVANALGLGGVPLVNTGLAILGQNTELDLAGIVGEGRGIMTEQRNPRGMGIETGNSPGGIPMQIGRLGSALFGLTGMMAFNVVDAGGQALRQDKNYDEALGVMLREGKGEFTSRVPVGGMWKAEEKVYMTPINKRLNEINQEMKTLDAQYSNEFSDSTEAFPNRPRVRDDDALNLLRFAHKRFSQGSYFKRNQQIGEMKKQIEAIETQKTEMTREQRLMQKKELMNGLQVLQDDQVAYADAVYDSFRDDFGELFAKYEEEPTLKGMTNLIRKVTK